MTSYQIDPVYRKRKMFVKRRVLFAEVRLRSISLLPHAEFGDAGRDVPLESMRGWGQSAQGAKWEKAQNKGEPAPTEIYNSNRAYASMQPLTARSAYRGGYGKLSGAGSPYALGGD